MAYVWYELCQLSNIRPIIAESVDSHHIHTKLSEDANRKGKSQEDIFLSHALKVGFIAY
jgi:hypothetical protein